MTEQIKQFEVLNEGDPGYPPYENQVQKNNRFIWDALRQPPKEALKPIQAGRLKGKTDINTTWPELIRHGLIAPLWVDIGLSL